MQTVSIVGSVYEGKSRALNNDELTIMWGRNSISKKKTQSFEIIGLYHACVCGRIVFVKYMSMNSKAKTMLRFHFCFWKAHNFKSHSKEKQKPRKDDRSNATPHSITSRYTHPLIQINIIIIINNSNSMTRSIDIMILLSGLLVAAISAPSSILAQTCKTVSTVKNFDLEKFASAPWYSK
jgi:hypothetical protein